MQNQTTQQAFKYACPYCGNIFYSYLQNGSICPFCKLYTDRSENELSDDALFKQLNTANSNIAQIKYYDLSSIESNVIAKRDPAYTYALAILYMKNSDIKHKEKNYSLGGFMEDNSKNEEMSHALYAKAKALLYDVIDACKKNESVNPELYYIEFLSEINLNRIYYAYKALEQIRKNEKNQHIVEYAEALYSLKTNNKNAVELANKLIKSGEPAINFDLAEFYARNGKLKEAKKILQTLASNSISMPNSKFLLDKINELLTL